MATQEERTAAGITRAAVDTAARELGHELCWKLGPNSNRKGCSYHLIGQCISCGASVAADAAGPACYGDRDALKWRCTQDALIAQVRQGRAKQGLPPTVEDPATLRRIAELLS